MFYSVCLQISNEIAKRINIIMKGDPTEDLVQVSNGRSGLYTMLYNTTIGHQSIDGLSDKEFQNIL